MDDTACLHVCLSLFIFALTGPCFTADSRGHKSLSKGKNACVLKIVLGEYRPQNPLLFPSEPLSCSVKYSPSNICYETVV